MPEFFFQKFGCGAENLVKIWAFLVIWESSENYFDQRFCLNGHINVITFKNSSSNDEACWFQNFIIVK